jgi:glutamine synthetase
MPAIYEYIWIDADNNLRSKVKVHHGVIDMRYITKIRHQDENGLVTDWNFDGSSTGQAAGSSSDVILRPVFVCNDPFRKTNYKTNHSFLVLCETLNTDGIPHVTNYHHICKSINERTSENESWFGFEQEYIIIDNVTGLPIGATSGMMMVGQEYYTKPCNTTNLPATPYYCSIGSKHNFGRNISELHLEYCLAAGLMICGTNAEVTVGQWEYQIGPLSGILAAHHLWMSRFILNKISEQFDTHINYHPKPYLNWNGSGCHTNFSTKRMREVNGYQHIIDACEKLSKVHHEHLLEYGDSEANKLRLTGQHETASYNSFKYGVSDRSASIRIPLNVFNEKKGYLEDRRPGSNCDPYRVVSIMLQTICN